MENKKGPIKTTVLLQGAIWVSMLVWGSVSRTRKCFGRLVSVDVNVGQTFVELLMICYIEECGY